MYYFYLKTKNTDLNQLSSVCENGIAGGQSDPFFIVHQNKFLKIRLKYIIHEN